MDAVDLTPAQLNALATLAMQDRWFARFFERRARQILRPENDNDL